tara:strand:+ start:333 stop:1076 length:744 start_codon:yes stop_codon:yes gene_type:complete
MFNILNIAGGSLIGFLLAWILILWVKVFVAKVYTEETDDYSENSLENKSIYIPEWETIIVLTIFAGVIAWWREWNPKFFSDIIFVTTLTGLALIDRKTMLIEGRMIALAIMLRLCWLLYFSPDDIKNSISGLLIGAGLLFMVGFLYETFRCRQGLGEGDAAVLGLIGMWVGWQGLGSVLLIASVTGITIGGISLLNDRGENKVFTTLLQTQIPFAPYLCLAGITVYLIQESVPRNILLSFDNFLIKF